MLVLLQVDLVLIWQSTRKWIWGMSRLLTLLLPISVLHTLTIRLLLLYNHAVILWKASTGHARPITSRFGMDLTINYIMDMRYVAVADPVVAYFCFIHNNHSFIIDLVEYISSSCCNVAFKTPEYGVGMKSFSSFIMLSIRGGFFVPDGGGS
jgi:hypothetical protein